MRMYESKIRNEKVGNIEYGNVDFEKVIIEILTSTRSQHQKR